MGPPFYKLHYVPHTFHHRHSTSFTEYRSSSPGLALCSFHLGISLGSTSVTGEMEMAFEDTYAQYCVHHFDQDGLVRIK